MYKLSLKHTPYNLKKEAIKKIGFELKEETIFNRGYFTRGYELVDYSSQDADKYGELSFTDINEVLKYLSNYLMAARICLTA